MGELSKQLESWQREPLRLCCLGFALHSFLSSQEETAAGLSSRLIFWIGEAPWHSTDEAKVLESDSWGMKVGDGWHGAFLLCQGSKMLCAY